jgi:hypothetical protein
MTPLYRNILMLSCSLCLGGAFLLLAKVSPRVPDEFRVWTEDPLVKIQPDTPVNSKHSIAISAARNETEPFQMIISSLTHKLEDVTISVSDLEDGRGNKITSSKITLYREEYVYVRNPSPYSPFPPGWWPDALIPFVNPYDGKAIPAMQLVRDGNGQPTKYRLSGARFPGSPFTVWPLRNQPVWGEILVPKDAVAGSYTGKLTVKCWACSPQTLPLKLTVWDFELPAGPSLSTDFGSLEGISTACHYPQGSQEAMILQDRYATAMEEHRLAAPIPKAYLPPVRSDGSIAWKQTHSNLKRFMDTHDTGPFRIPNFPGPASHPKFKKRFSRYLQTYYEYLNTQGWSKGAFYYPVDEPNTREAYEQVRSYAQLIHDSEPRIRLLCTEQTYPQDNSWGELQGSVDIWCPLFAFFDKSSAEKALKRGNQLWTYTALCQKAPTYHPEFQKVGGVSTFFWQIDFPSLNFRLPFWVIWKDQIQGLLYWSMVHWSDPVRDVWTDPAFRNRYNGEGYFFYPGTEAGIRGPVTSLRLKVLREGIEDLAYLKLLDQLGEHEFVSAQVSNIASSWWKWNSDPQQLYQTRAALAQKIMEKQGNPALK